MSSTSKHLVLMNRTHAVAIVRYDFATRHITAIHEILDEGLRAPIGFASADDKSTFLDQWWSNRSIPVERPNIEKALGELGIRSLRELSMFDHGLSLSDHYWMRRPNEDVGWESINFFNNLFSDDLGKILMGFAENTRSGIDLRSPDNTSDGLLPKRWMVEGDRRYLLKGARNNAQEPTNEVIASELHGRLLEPDEFVTYRLVEEGDQHLSICENMLADDEEYVPMQYVRQLISQKGSGGKPQNGADDFEHTVECCKTLGIHDVERKLSQMIVCDYLIANSDRHYRNFGIIRNVETLKCRMAPLFDSGTSLWCDSEILSFDTTAYRSKPFFGIPEQQLCLTRDLAWYDRDKLDGFAAFASERLLSGPLERRPGRAAVIEATMNKNIATVDALAHGMLERSTLMALGPHSYLGVGAGKGALYDKVTAATIRRATHL
jgi:hypothetical protein